MTGALSSCSAPPPTEPASSVATTAPRGCAIGFSGPTLHPGDAIRNARRDALTQLAAGGEDAVVRVRSELLVTAGAGGGEVTRQDLSGSVRDARIVATWAERVSAGGSATERHVYALACGRDAEAASPADPALPAWIPSLASDPSRACAVGIGGPTLDPRDQRDAALRDARRALASSLESDLDAILIDTGRRPWIASELRATERAVARARRVASLDAAWTDARGVGPLGLERTLYGLVCVSR